VGQWGGQTELLAALGGRHLHGQIPAGTAASLMSWDGVAQVLVNQRLVPPDIKVVQSAGREFDPKHYLDRDSAPRRESQPIVDPGRLRSILRGGATLVIDNIDELVPAIGATAWELAGIVREFVRCDLYASAGDAPAFAPHWDAFDVLVVQIEG